MLVGCLGAVGNAFLVLIDIAVTQTVVCPEAVTRTGGGVMLGNAEGIGVGISVLAGASKNYHSASTSVNCLRS